MSKKLNKYLTKLSQKNYVLSRMNFARVDKDDENFLAYLREIKKTYEFALDILKNKLDSEFLKDSLREDNNYHHIYELYQDYKKYIKEYLINKSIVSNNIKFNELLKLLTKYKLRLPKEIYEHIKENYRRI
jgi:hypothetical protein